MYNIIETSLDTADGLADCSLEPMETDNGLYYAVTILYPHIVNGFSRSEIYCHDMVKGGDGQYQFDPIDENIHPKIHKLESLLAALIAKS